MRVVRSHHPFDGQELAVLGGMLLREPFRPRHHNTGAMLGPRPRTRSGRPDRVAAATGIAMVPTSARVSFRPRINLDHRFLFLNRDASTGTVLFASESLNPAAQ